MLELAHTLQQAMVSIAESEMSDGEIRHLRHIGAVADQTDIQTDNERQHMPAVFSRKLPSHRLSVGLLDTLTYPRIVFLHLTGISSAISLFTRCQSPRSNEES